MGFTQIQQFTSTDTFRQRSTPTLADLDGDGDLDIIVGWGESTFIVFDLFRNDGTAIKPSFDGLTASGQSVLIIDLPMIMKA